MDYDDSLRWLLSLPDFERTGTFASRPDVEPMRALLDALGAPHLGRPTAHIAGSKGKGSTGAMIEAVLRAAGRRTGYYISPHLHRYNERLRIDAQPAERDLFAASMTAVREAIAAVEPRFPGRAFIAFDALTASSFVAFRESAVDVQIVETGLGGRLDSTNVFHETSDIGHRTADGDTAPARPHVVVLTPISLEHTDLLGSTIAAIAGEKAGIITTGATVVAAPQRESALDVFHAAAVTKNATVIEVAKVCQMARTSATADGQDFRLKTSRETYTAKLPLAGRHQLDNAATAIVAAEELAAAAGFELTAAHVRSGLGALSWPGRLEVLRRKPLVIVDGAHNGDSAKRMVAALREYFGLSHAVFLFGTLAGKDVASMAEAVAPIAESVFVTAWPSARAEDPRLLAEAFRPHGVPVSTFADLAAAFEAASAHAGARGALVAFGAIAFVASVREYLLGIESDILRLASIAPGQMSDGRSDRP
jgi:dihydrofolate synthase/folylpolyglutamate synthase